MTFFAIHGACYAAAVYLITRVSIDRVRKIDARHRIESTDARAERIARLEIATGVGLHVGREWLMNQPIAAQSQSMRELAEEGNCHVERKCWGCEKLYRPNADSEYGAAIYNTKRIEDGRQGMRQRLCASCFDGALTELERL